jgi:hypothetical protein
MHDVYTARIEESPCLSTVLQQDTWEKGRRLGDGRHLFQVRIRGRQCDSVHYENVCVKNLALRNFNSGNLGCMKKIGFLLKWVSTVLVATP